MKNPPRPFSVYRDPGHSEQVWDGCVSQPGHELSSEIVLGSVKKEIAACKDRYQPRSAGDCHREWTPIFENGWPTRRDTELRNGQKALTDILSAPPSADSRIPEPLLDLHESIYLLLPHFCFSSLS